MIQAPRFQPLTIGVDPFLKKFTGHKRI